MPLHEIIREVEQAAEEQERQMEQREGQLREQAARLQQEALDLQERAMRAASPRVGGRLMKEAAVKAAEAQRAQQDWQTARVQNTTARAQVRFAVSNLKQMDPRVQAEKRLRVGICWGVSLSAYFVMGYGFFSSVFIFILTNFSLRVLMGFRRGMRAGRDAARR